MLNPVLALVRPRSRHRQRPRVGVRLSVRSHGAENTQVQRLSTGVSGRTYYSPGQGRFLGRDPKDEKGGLHLYAFCLNSPIDLWDYLGMDPYMDKLQQQQSALESEIQGLKDTIQGLIDDENNAYVRRGWHQSSIDAHNERIASSGKTLGKVLESIS